MVLKKDLTIKQKLQFAVVDTEWRDCIMWATSMPRECTTRLTFSSVVVEN
jgi:hypothetical protein